MKYSDVRLGMKVKITDPECGKYGGAPVGTVMTVTGLPDIGSDIFILSDGSGYWPTRFDPADQEFSVGDKVRVKYATYGCTEQDVGKVRTVLGVSKDTITLSVHGFVHRPEALELVKKVEVIEETYGQKQNKWLEENKVIVGSNVLVKRALEPNDMCQPFGNWHFPYFVLEPVHVECATDLAKLAETKQASVLFRRLSVKGTPCVKIVGFEGVLEHDQLPEKYKKFEQPYFYLSDCTSSGFPVQHVFDGKDILNGGCASGKFIKICLPSEYAFKLLSGWSDRLFVGDIIPEKTFNEIMVWLRRAGARLAKINKNTKQERGKNVESVHDVCSPNRRYCVDDPERALI